jgi:hypothetical protein
MAAPDDPEVDFLVGHVVTAPFGIDVELGAVGRVLLRVKLYEDEGITSQIFPCPPDAADEIADRLREAAQRAREAGA